MRVVVDKVIILGVCRKLGSLFARCEANVWIGYNAVPGAAVLVVTTSYNGSLTSAPPSELWSVAVRRVLSLGDELQDGFKP